MKTQYDFTKITKEELLMIVRQQEQAVNEQKQLVNQLSKQVHFLEEQLLAYQLRQFANKSEKINLHQASLFDAIRCTHLFKPIAM
jgi:hypothetical protein